MAPLSYSWLAGIDLLLARGSRLKEAFGVEAAEVVGEVGGEGEQEEGEGDLLEVELGGGVELPGQLKVEDIV